MQVFIIRKKYTLNRIIVRVNICIANFSLNFSIKKMLISLCTKVKKIQS